MRYTSYFPEPKFIYSSFSASDNTSSVFLADKNGTYIGHAKFNPEDKENRPNEITGGSIAELRARIAQLKEIKKTAKIKLNAIEKLNKDISLVCGPIDKKIQRRINLQLRNYKEDIKNAEAGIEHAKFQLNYRFSVKEKINKKRSKKLN